jgi:hypothetical protein
MRTRNLIGFMLGLVAIALFAAWMSRAEATEPKPTTQTQNQTQSTSQSISADVDGSTASNHLTERTTAIGVSSTAPEPLHATPECFLPAKGIRRVRQALWGAVSLDSRLVPDQACMDALIATREYNLAKLAAEIQLEQARIARITAEHARSCSAVADRVAAACVSK